ncbi:Protein CBG16580 [Caenorhabditis briggsae]|uniref:Uncharacterized protein n=2 Tax=Caenorhabditis briggsae TaxID=6238 RepID=A0AAE9DCA8_CAEBR|nr:Protein CBG16580 [Caenorhabditis briggsae]ULU01147.1 hypothetical protein L3Y34_001484 [Caenorhabditis briggsae]CAP34507.2 Protein CBG16580 [Caenorhabditis briggsae]
MTKSTKLRHCKQKKKKPEKAEKSKTPIVITEKPSFEDVAITSSTTDGLLGSTDSGGSRSKSRNRKLGGLCCCTAQTATLSPIEPTDYGGIASTNNNGMIGSLCRDSRAPSRNSRSGSSRSQQAKHQPIDPDEPSTSGTTDRRPSTHFMLDLPVVSTRCKSCLEKTSDLVLGWFDDVLMVSDIKSNLVYQSKNSQKRCYSSSKIFHRFPYLVSYLIQHFPFS